MRRTALMQRTPDRMSPSEERALLPTSRGKDDERALSPTALIYASAHSEASRPTFFHSAATCPHEPEARRTASGRPSRGSGGPTNGTWSAAVKS